MGFADRRLADELGEDPAPTAGALVVHVEASAISGP